MHTISIKTQTAINEVVKIISENLHYDERIHIVKNMGSWYYIEVNTKEPLHWVADKVEFSEIEYGYL
jgi:hypothetical protein